MNWFVSIVVFDTSWAVLRLTLVAEAINTVKRFTQTNPIVQIAEYHGFKPVQSKSQVNLQSGIYPSTWNTGNCWVDISYIHIEKTCQREIGDLRKKKISAIKVEGNAQ